MYDCIKPGQIWNDVEGNPIQAHGFSVFYQDGVYYWYGENKEFSKKGGKIWSWGVNCYVSRDLYNWEKSKLIIPPAPDDPTNPLYPNYCMDRPHIVYCKNTKKYVAWLKIMSTTDDFQSQFMCVLQADRFLGPYTFVQKCYNPLGMNAGDFDLIINEDKGYIIFERPHFEMICATLSDDYTSVTGEFSTHFENTRPPYTREAPAYFERKGKKYLFTSGTSGYFPNQSKVALLESMHGRYIDLGNPHIDDSTKTSFSSQISSVFKVPNRDLYIALADRWITEPVTARDAKKFQTHMKRIYKNYVPDRTPKNYAVERLLSGKEQIFDFDTSLSRYVWLPVEWKNEKPVIRWQDEWRIESYPEE